MNDAKTQEILGLFEGLSAIPRNSREEARILAWIRERAERNGWFVQADRHNNLDIRTPGSPGGENAPRLALQAHLDMVCQKAPGSSHDFSTDPIRFIYDGDWLRADGTTLGADNGIGLALALALAEDPGVLHPPLELLFTADEETGLGGANLLEPGFLEARRLLNLDSEEEGVFTVGCAGGVTANIELALEWEAIPDQSEAQFTLEIGGLLGGHSGIDIHKHRASANRLMIRALGQALRAAPGLQLVSLTGGTAHNAIARESTASIAVPVGEVAALSQAVDRLAEALKREYATTETGLQLSLQPATASQMAVSRRDTARLVHFLMTLPQGIARLSPEIAGFVDTSNNLGIVEVLNGRLRVVSSQRSATASRLADQNARLEASAALVGASVRYSGGYPAWQPDLNSELLKNSQAAYHRLFGRQPQVRTIHAGLETGTIGEKYPGMDMLSLGVTICDPHSPRERMYLPAVGRVWDLLVEVLKSCC